MRIRSVVHLISLHPGPLHSAVQAGYHGVLVEEERPIAAERTEGNQRAVERLDPRARTTRNRYRVPPEIRPAPNFVGMRSGDTSCTWRTLMTMEKDPSDEQRRQMDLQLVRMSLEGEEGAVGILAARLSCVPRILVALNRRMGRPLSEHDLADLSQDTLVIIWGKLGTFEGRAKLESWVYRFCFLSYMNLFRREKRHSSLTNTRLEKVIDTVAAPVATPIRDYEILELTLDELGSPEAEVIRLKHFEEFTFKEIGETLDISANTAKTRYYRGLAWLRRRLAGPAREERR